MSIWFFIKGIKVVISEFTQDPGITTTVPESNSGELVVLNDFVELIIKLSYVESLTD